MTKILYLLLKIILALLIVFILILASGFFAVKFGWTNVAGEEDDNSYEYNLQAEKNKDLIKTIELSKATSTENISSSTNSFGLPETISIYGVNEKENWCKISVAKDFNSHTAELIFEAYHNSKSEILLNNMLLALKLRLPNKDEFENKLKLCQKTTIFITPEKLTEYFIKASSSNLYNWQNGESWQIIASAITKDKDMIFETAEKVGIQPRLLVSVAIVEQLRLYYTQRELFEKFFKPLKILANANKMAWGVMAIKEKTAIQTEEHLKDINSSFYLGSSSSALLNFPDYSDASSTKEIEKKINKERYDRLTNKKSHYYSYLYGALIIKQLQAQWELAGYPIEYRPEIVATLFNIGFNNSSPKENPKVGGSTIEIGEDKYHFGSLAFEFYYSGELSKEFPFE